MKRRAAVEPVIGHLKGDHRMDRNFLVGRQPSDHVGLQKRLLVLWGSDAPAETGLTMEQPKPDPLTVIVVTT
jgi:hypothetical protein